MRAKNDSSPAVPQDYLVIVSPGETWQTIWLVTDAPSASEAEQMVWTERGYNSGEPVRVRSVADRHAATLAAKYVTRYNATRVNASREMVRFND